MDLVWEKIFFGGGGRGEILLPNREENSSTMLHGWVISGNHDYSRGGFLIVQDEGPQTHRGVPGNTAGGDCVKGQVQGCHLRLPVLVAEGEGSCAPAGLLSPSEEGEARSQSVTACPPTR